MDYPTESSLLSAIGRLRAIKKRRLELKKAIYFETEYKKSMTKRQRNYSARWGGAPQERALI